MTPPSDRYRAPALDKGLDILELLASEAQPLTRAEIVRAMGRSPSEIYRMLERLVARHYVTRTLEGDRYTLSLKLFTLGQRHPPLDRFVAQALPCMDAFAKAAEQSCHLGIYDRGNLTVVAQVNGPGKWGLAIRTGAQVSLVDTGSGHVMLAFQDDARREAMLGEHQPVEGEVPIAPRPLKALLARVRQQGFWEGDSRQAHGITDLSVPVKGPSGEALAVLTCPYIRRIDRHPAADLATARSLLLQAAQHLALA